MTLTISEIFHGPNAAWVLELYEQYLANPATVDASTRAFFEASLGKPAPGATSQPASIADTQKALATARYVQSIRSYGYLEADLDPLHSMRRGDPELAPEFHGLSREELQNLPASYVDSPVTAGTENAWEASERLRSIYCASIGHDWGHIRDPKRRDWLRATAETRRYHPDSMLTDRRKLLQRLSQVEGFEKFLHRMYPGKTRFSIEGLDTMILLLDEVIERATPTSINNVLIGMAHRGRLNVLAHTLEMPYRQIFSDYKGGSEERFRALYEGWQGDVTYHRGGRRKVSGNKLTITLVPNPSHLEHVNPVMTGMARATGTARQQPGKALFNRSATLPIIIHGDAAFTGQGIVAETLNMSQLHGYRTGGTLHIIANNQIGFTTDPFSSRSTRHASDIAKGYGIPVVHVNADDPEAVIEVARIAQAYMDVFESDIVVNLIGYRRYGHNEGDEPRHTQPRMYQLIEQMPTVREKYAAQLLKRGLIDAGYPEELQKRFADSLQVEYTDSQSYTPEPPESMLRPEPRIASRIETKVPAESLRELNAALAKLPEGFALHKTLQKVLEKRANALNSLDEKSIDWGTAEALAFASIIADGTPCRLTGEDVWRGTFSHRHAVLHDINTNQQYIPLHNLPQSRASFEIRNSPLSENAAVGFEIGYSIQASECLVLWEGQYGDFVNGAQVIIDEYLVSARDKWGMYPSLVMLLPHGHEGGGPDHSSCRPERFLQLTADINLRVVNPTTPAQIFHLLRRQSKLLKLDPLPLIVLSPKSLLRHPQATSSLRELAEGIWQSVLPDTSADPQKVTRVLLCSGKVYYDLTAENAVPENTAIVRLEQLYPLHKKPIAEAIESFPLAKEVCWVQEEPENMGAWEFVRPHLQEMIGERSLRYIGRPRQSSPSEGGATWHKSVQKKIIAQALGA